MITIITMIIFYYYDIDGILKKNRKLFNVKQLLIGFSYVQREMISVVQEQLRAAGIFLSGEFNPYCLYGEL